MAHVYRPGHRGTGEPRPGQCCASVQTDWRSYQCTRKGTLREPDRDGTEREWCKQHAPSTEATANAERTRRWEAEHAAYRRSAEQKERAAKLAAACVEFVKQLAHGDAHPLPRLEAQELLSRFAEPKQRE